MNEPEVERDLLREAFDAVDQFIGSSVDDRSLLMRAKVRGLMRGYHAKWIDQDYEALTVEETITSDMWNPETGRKSRSFKLAGKEDVLLKQGDRKVIMDHKTTSDAIDDPLAPYWKQLIVEGQPSHYMLIEWLNGNKVDAAVWDVVRKPSIRPASITKAEMTSLLQSQHYYGFPVSSESMAAVRETPRETLELYEYRLAFDCTETRPAWYFQRRETMRIDAEIAEYARDLWEHSQELLHVRYTNRHTRNFKACLQHNTPCKFLGICSGYDTPDSDNWQRKPQVHVELPTLQGDGRDVLTISRLGTFMLCRKKHYYEYELGIERQDQEEADALYFGSMWHAAMEAWFKGFVRKEHVYVNNSDAAAQSSLFGTVNQ